MFYVLNGSIIANFSCLDLRLVLSNLAEITGKGQRTSHETLTTSFLIKIAYKYVSTNRYVEYQASYYNTRQL